MGVLGRRPLWLRGKSEAQDDNMKTDGMKKNRLRDTADVALIAAMNEQREMIARRKMIH